MVCFDERKKRFGKRVWKNQNVVWSFEILILSTWALHLDMCYKLDSCAPPKIKSSMPFNLKCMFNLFKMSESSLVKNRNNKCAEQTLTQAHTYKQRWIWIRWNRINQIHSQSFSKFTNASFFLHSVILQLKRQIETY